MPASKLSPPPVSFLTFAGKLPAPQWLHSDCSGGVKILLQVSPSDSFQVSCQLPPGIHFSLDLDVPRVPALASTLVIHRCQPWLPLWESTGAHLGIHFGLPWVPL